MSYTATWDHLLALTKEANLLSKVQSGHWIWAYDNLNIHLTTRHERQGSINSAHQHGQNHAVHAGIITYMYT